MAAAQSRSSGTRRVGARKSKKRGRSSARLVAATGMGTARGYVTTLERAWMAKRRCDSAMWN